MFCGNCGSQNPDGLTKCSVCGAPLTEEKKSNKGGDILAKAGLAGMDKNKLTGYAVIAAVALVVVILLIVLLSGRGDTSTVKQYVKAVYNLDGKKIVNLEPKAGITIYAEAEDISKGDAKEEMIDAMQKTLDNLAERYEKQIDLDEVKSLKVELRKENKYTKKQIRDLNESYEDEYDVKLKAKEVKSVEVKVSGKYDGDKFHFNITIELIKIGGSWYIMSASASQLFSQLASAIE